MKKKVVVAMSGGVDSSVAAALLLKEGYEVIGITIQIWPDNLPPEDFNTRSCCFFPAARDAFKVSRLLGIPHYVLNLRELFTEKVISNFVEEYMQGRTPNPCIRCNEYIKFEVLLNKARSLGADYLATGHYARIEYDEDKNLYQVFRGTDQGKDQTYFLYVLCQKTLPYLLFPEGKRHKEEIRAIAKDLGLPVSEKKESQEICFVPYRNYGEFINRFLSKPVPQGPIYDRQGRLLGYHKGIYFYTIGQRRKLGISSKEALYVLEIKPEENALIVGPESELYKKRLKATSLNWVSIPQLKQELIVEAKIRYNSPAAKAVVVPQGKDEAVVEFQQPQKAITPGQAVVFYQGDLLLGGGIITKL